MTTHNHNDNTFREWFQEIIGMMTPEEKKMTVVEVMDYDWDRIFDACWDPEDALALWRDSQGI